MKESKNNVEHEYRIVGGGGGTPATVGKLREMLADLPQDAIVIPSEYGITVHCDYEDNAHNSMEDATIPVNSMAGHALRVYGGLYDTDELEKRYQDFLKDNDNDNSAMTYIEMRGPIEYYPSDYNRLFPPVIAESFDVQRKNNTNFVNTLMELEARAIMKKTQIDIEAAKAKYEAFAEYITQCDMHNTGAVMCQIVAEQLDNIKQ